MGRKWTMTKMLDSIEVKEAILQLDDEELEVEKNLLEFWPQSKVERLMTDIKNGVKITLFDVSINEAEETTMKRLACEEFHIKWDFRSKGYMEGDEILMGWDIKNERLCYRVLPISAFRTYPQIADNFASSFHPIE